MKMLKSDEVGEDVFLDSVDSFRSCDSSFFVEESVDLDYQLWNSEPASVVERREMFLRGMGLTDFVCPQELSSSSVDRIVQCSGAVPSTTLCSVSNRGEEDTSCSGRDVDIQSRSTWQMRNTKPRKVVQILPDAQHLMSREATAQEEHVEQVNVSKKKIKNWWNLFVQKKIKDDIRKKSAPFRDSQKPKENRMKVRRNRKKCMEFTAVYMGQQVQAHKGFIWTMKFSPDGKYLASGGEDGVVRIWRVTSTDATCRYFTAKDTSKFDIGRKLIPGRKRLRPPSVVIPQKVFKIDEMPLHEFYGHTDDVLDLCWSQSNCLLSSSKDETVRLWQVGSDECLQVFTHNNYVTCIQFNPVDDKYFISGSIDGKVRVWGISKKRVVDWADIRDIITALCYQPDGQGFVVGSVSGHCRFYDSSGSNLQLDAQICVQGRKKSSSNRITGFQFSPEDNKKVLITSADSKVRIFDGLDVIHKYRGLRKSGSQMSASFTSNGRHIISVGEDSRIYVWNYDGMCAASSKQAKSIRSCEHFLFEGVSVAIPWRGIEHERLDSSRSSSQTVDHSVTSSLLKDSARFSLGGWFSMDSRLRGLATWPEEKLPLWSVPVEGTDDRHQQHHHGHHDYCDERDQDHHCRQDHPKNYHSQNNHAPSSSTWGLVIVTGGADGVIRTFHNYGLPVRL